MIQVHCNYICDFCNELWYVADYELHSDNRHPAPSVAGNRIGTAHACMECMAKAREAVRKGENT